MVSVVVTNNKHCCRQMMPPLATNFTYSDQHYCYCIDEFLHHYHHLPLEFLHYLVAWYSATACGPEHIYLPLTKVLKLLKVQPQTRSPIMNDTKVSDWALSPFWDFYVVDILFVKMLIISSNRTHNWIRSSKSCKYWLVEIDWSNCWL